jgi:hypothetical protein
MPNERQTLYSAIIGKGGQNVRGGILRCGALALLCIAGFAHAAEPDRRIALTIDDLPWQQSRVGSTLTAVSLESR